MSTNVSLREITHEILESILTLEVSESQKVFYTRSNAYSIAEAHYPVDDDPVWIRAIYANETPVGFLMTSESPDRGEYYLWRIMIDEKYQSKGYAALAVKNLIQRIKDSPNGKLLITSHLEVNDHAGRFFEKMGFSYTGEILGESDRLMNMYF